MVDMLLPIPSSGGPRRARRADDDLGLPEDHYALPATGPDGEQFFAYEDVIGLDGRRVTQRVGTSFEMPEWYSGVDYYVNNSEEVHATLQDFAASPVGAVVVGGAIIGGVGGAVIGTNSVVNAASSIRERLGRSGYQQRPGFNTSARSGGGGRGAGAGGIPYPSVFGDDSLQAMERMRLLF